MPKPIHKERKMPKKVVHKTTGKLGEAGRKAVVLDELGFTREFIAHAREVLRPSKVKINHMPGWLTKRMLVAKKAGKFSSLFLSRSGSNMMVEILAAMPRLSHWADHFGSTILARGGKGPREFFVAEPYGLTEQSALGAIQFAEMLDLGIEIDANSWHYPGSTVRIIFWPKEE